ncbi:hypothetical protein FRC08_003593 [Ceratobasidium sp. 394]|nr:hypothetical protein FRC08_003593 [Ceratobasidium sp. 394]
MIPREEEARQAWIQSLGEQIEQEVAWRHEHDIKGDKYFKSEFANNQDLIPTISHLGRALLFERIQLNDGGLLRTDGFDIDWTYVIDLDNRAFTINGLMHFRLDNIPPGSLNAYLWRIPSPEYPGETCIPTYAHPPSTPVEYIATVSRWPSPRFNVSQTCEEYAQLAPIVLSANDWGAPTWWSLTIVQQLSATLVQTILLDSAEKMANPDVVKMQSAFDICRWQLLSAAAPSHLCCPPEPSNLEKAQNPRALSIEELREDSAYLNCLTPHYSKPRSWEQPDYNLTCYWFAVLSRSALDWIKSSMSNTRPCKWFTASANTIVLLELALYFLVNTYLLFHSMAILCVARTHCFPTTCRCSAKMDSFWRHIFLVRC